MNRYGQSLLAWSTIAAPRPCTGIPTSYSYRLHSQRQLEDNESGDNVALIQHSTKAEIAFDARVTVGSTDFFNLGTAGAALVLNGVNNSDNSVIVITRAVERWALGQSKTISVQATHYPDMIQAGAALANKGLSAFTPDQAALGIVAPGGVMRYGTFGLNYTSAVVHMLELTQELQITEDEPSPDGKILGCATHGYLRSLNLELLVKTGFAAPRIGDVLAIDGAPAHASNYKIESVDQRLSEKKGEMYSVGAVWIPPFN